MANEAKQEHKIENPFVSVQVGGNGTTRNAEARKAIASALFTKGLYFLGLLGKELALRLIAGETVKVGKHSLTFGSTRCSTCGNYSGYREKDKERKARLL